MIAWYQASLIGYNQIREIEENDDKIEYLKNMARAMGNKVR